MDYKEKLNHPKWQKRRLEIMQKADWKCEKCGCDSEQLHVHHTDYKAGGPNPWDYEDQYLQCICATCHTLSHIERGRILKFIGLEAPQPEIRYLLGDKSLHDQLKDIDIAFEEMCKSPPTFPAEPDYAYMLLKRRTKIQQQLREQGYGV
jgi:hypothetical protein